MAQQVKTVVAYADIPSSNPRTHIVKRENQLPKLFSDFHIQACMCGCVHALTYKITNEIQKISVAHFSKWINWAMRPALNVGSTRPWAGSRLDKRGKEKAADYTYIPPLPGPWM